MEMDRLELWVMVKRTLGAFLPALDWGKGAGAAFFPDLGGCH